MKQEGGGGPGPGPHMTLRPHNQVNRATTAPNGREDCWSEDATSALIGAWGDRYLQLNRGNLRQKDWKEVSDAVNSRHNGAKARKTDVQCKNRIDTLKKKFKVEKSKPSASTWIFYDRLDRLIGDSVKAAIKAPAKTPLRSPLPLTVKFPRSAVYSSTPPSAAAVSSSKLSPVSSSESSRGGVSGSDNSGDGGGDDDEEEDAELGFEGRKLRRVEGGGGDGAMRELARAIVRFGEIYERIESSKQRQMVELERQKMEFMKELEFQRMQMFMEAQLQLEKMKRPKYNSAASGKKL